MTNFEKILRGTSIADMADALSASFEGQCGECPAQLICQSVEDESDVGCTDVLKLWLNMEAEPSARDRASELFGKIGSCKKCPAIEECRANMDADCIDILTAYVEAHEADPMPEAPREVGGFGGPWPVCNPGWGGNRITCVDSHGRVHEIGCGGAGARAYDINGELVLELPE